ncbi:adhesion G-protein coupled receptor G7-like [Scomber japonicus]|uniref:adhesion G-protein coupled receptor G7-like n=1 Tax=Scomber japonicus TaxID=13676 RepID=UPI002306233A|nr:adhesion G-protein coupled receptor G7-like [Scomber japonicus]
MGGNQWGMSASVLMTGLERRNFCKNVTLGGFNFRQTPIGWFAYSEEKCEEGTSSAGKPKASTRCSIQNGEATFSRPENFTCGLTLSDLKQNLSSPADFERLAACAQILTSKPEELTSENVTAAAHIANTLLLSPNATESVRVAAVATVSQLLNASVSSNTEENNTTLGLTRTLDELSLNLSSTTNSSQSEVVQPNLVVQSARLPAENTQGVQFTSLRGLSGSFAADRIKLNTNTSSVVMENGFIADALILVRFPPEDVNSRQMPTNVSLGFVLYQNDHFFRSRDYRKRRNSIRVLSASVRGQERSVVPQHIEMQFRPTGLNISLLHDFACVFWNYTLEDWSTAGCFKQNTSGGALRCVCNHTTNFAALWFEGTPKMAMSGQGVIATPRTSDMILKKLFQNPVNLEHDQKSVREEHEYAEQLNTFSIVGLSLSIFGLVVTIIHHGREINAQNRNSKMALLFICISLLAFIITFLSGVQNPNRKDNTEHEPDIQNNEVPESDEYVAPDRGSCTVVTALLHFFLLATFMWNAIYGTQVMLLVRTMRRNLPPHWTSGSIAAGWGIPAVVMAITLGATYRVDNPLGYRQEEFCWLAALNEDDQFDFGKPMFWGFLLPVGLILIYNVVLLVLVSLTTCRTDPRLNSSNALSMRKKFLTSLSLAVLMGLSWTLGYLVLTTRGNENLFFSIFFCICTTTQGFLIFILFTARTRTFRDYMSKSAEFVSSVNIQSHNRRYVLWKDWDKSTSSETYRDRNTSSKTF